MNTKNTLIAIVALFATTATFAQVGIGTIAPHATAALDVESTTKGFLPPRMTTAQRDAIASPAEGLTIFNTTENCLQWYNGIGWYDGCDGSTFVAPVLGGGFTNGFEDNSTCTTKVISVTPCSVVSGATLNDDTGTTDGTEYDWTGATGFVDGGTTRALVEIGGQCWYRRNAVNTPSAYDPVPTWVNTTDVGWSGEYTGGPFSDEGKLYQWSAAMNDSTTERAQGVCPTGWHVPSDCEWMYLENTLGMTTADQQVNNNWRNSGDVGRKLSNEVTSGTNSSGFTALLAGYRSIYGSFDFRSTIGSWWSSSGASTTNAPRRRLGSSSSQAGVGRNSTTSKANGFSVRCLKD